MLNFFPPSRFVSGDENWVPPTESAVPIRLLAHFEAIARSCVTLSVAVLLVELVGLFDTLLQTLLRILMESPKMECTERHMANR